MFMFDYKHLNSVNSILLLPFYIVFSLKAGIYYAQKAEMVQVLRSWAI